MGPPPPPRSVAHCQGTRSRPMDCSNHREAFAFRNRAHQLRADRQRALLVEERCGGASGGGLAEPHWPARLRAMTPLSLQAVLPSLHRRSSSAVRVCACVHVGEQTCAGEQTKMHRDVLLRSLHLDGHSSTGFVELALQRTQQGMRVQGWKGWHSVACSHSVGMQQSSKCVWL